MKFRGNTRTFLMATQAQARELSSMLRKAMQESDENDEASYVHIVLSQAEHEGPWELAIGVFPSEGVNSR